ncbi:MAG: aldo/keto reductase, partial [Anaerolineaceae bacterium]|nr:aldo/keto reductase [Anaerolineaceae bacterium]
MHYRRLGRTNLQVSELSYGAARGNTEHPQQIIHTIHTAIDAGINFFDTAEGYDGGDSERVLGEALRGHDDVIVETKYCPYDSYLPEAKYVGTPEKLIASAEESLRRLGRDHLDIFLGHGMRSLETLDRFMNDGCYEAMLRLKEQGKVRHIGISELSEGDGTHQVLQRAVPSGAFDVVMLTVNILLQTAAESVIPLCEQHDVGMVVMMPLNQASKVSGLV